MTQSWTDAQKWEAEWHGNCVNSINEELKQFVYMKKMGLRFSPIPKTPYNIDLQGKSVLDIGGGAYSLLLKCTNFSRAVVCEPIEHPEWVMSRYKAHKVDFWNIAGELLDPTTHFPSFAEEKFDEVWIYNCLQHTQDPELIIGNARKVGKLIRIFEWVDHPISDGHLHVLTEQNLNKWLGGEGKVENINESGCNGKCYYGIFLP